MKRKFIPIKILLTVVLSILCCFALFGCDGEPQVPEVKDLAIVAADGSSYGKVGALHELTYTVPEGSEVSTSVKVGDSFAPMADYSCIDGGYIFYTAGEYTVTVYAAKDGMLGSAETTITVHDSEVSVSDVKISAAAGETLGKAGALHVLTYSANADCDVRVEIKKGDEAATDVTFDSTYNTIVFGSQGQYTVTVTATLGTASDSASTQIEIGAVEKPTVTLSLDKSAVQEDEAVTLKRTVTYDKGDRPEQESISVFYRAEANGTFREAEADTYTVTGERLTPHVAGEWKIVYKAQGEASAESEAEAEFKCNPAEISLSLQTAARQRIQTNTATDLEYLVTGAVDKYNVTFDAHGNSGVKAEKGDGHSVRVTAENVDYFTVTVIYTHKVKSSVQKKIDVDVYSVESLTYAPAFGEDPFDGMPSEVLTSVGHLFYFNATTCGGAKRELNGGNAKYQVENANVTANASVDIMYAADNENYPYVLVSNFGNNTATGSFTVKMTLTDPATGYSAIATKNFTVRPTNNSGAVIRDHVKNNSFYRIAQMNFDNAAEYSRENMVLTKTGTIMQRRNADFSTGDFAHMDFATAANNCRLEFKFNLLAPNPSSGEVWLGIGMRTVTTGGWVGFFDLHVVDGKLDITTGLQAVGAEYVSVAERPLAENDTTLFVRIDRSVNGDVAEYTVYVKTDESAPYQQFYRCTAKVSQSGGDAGAPVKQYQFTHRNGGGCYAVEDVTITDYDD